MSIAPGLGVCNVRPDPIGVTPLGALWADLGQLPGTFSRFPARLAQNDRSKPIQIAILIRRKNQQRSRSPPILGAMAVL